MKKEKQKNCKGFTLLELLVVVVIIGILAAVALPQYKKAVRKSRFVEIVTALHTIMDAENRYFLANGTYTQDGDRLDIDFPLGITSYDGHLSQVKASTNVTCGLHAAVDRINYVYCVNPDISLWLFYYFGNKYYMCRNTNVNDHVNDDLCKKFVNTTTTYGSYSYKNDYLGYGHNL